MLIWVGKMTALECSLAKCVLTWSSALYVRAQSQTCLLWFVCSAILESRTGRTELKGWMYIMVNYPNGGALQWKDGRTADRSWLNGLMGVGLSGAQSIYSLTERTSASHDSLRNKKERPVALLDSIHFKVELIDANQIGRSPASTKTLSRSRAHVSRS